MKVKSKLSGFTLLEVMVALLVVAFCLGAALDAVGQFADERARLNGKVAANSVAWNQLMVQYQTSQGWSASRSNVTEKNGDVEEAGREWFWEMQSVPSLGEDFYRYQIDVYEKDQRDKPSVSSLAAYFVTD